MGQEGRRGEGRGALLSAHWGKVGARQRLWWLASEHVRGWESRKETVHPSGSMSRAMQHLVAQGPDGWQGPGVRVGVLCPLQRTR